jgi:ATP-dependent RNA helicase DeaD
MPAELLAHLKKVWVSGQRLRISRVAAQRSGESRPRAPHEDGTPRERKPSRRTPPNKHRG